MQEKSQKKFTWRQESDSPTPCEFLNFFLMPLVKILAGKKNLKFTWHWAIRFTNAIGIFTPFFHRYWPKFRWEA
jgi:hypothetical protein